jgi:hypothetical protein
MADSSTRSRLLTFRSGGWVLALTALLTVLIVVVTVLPAVRRHRDRPPGDGRDPATYGFDLGHALVDVDDIAAGQLHRDLIGALVDPPTMAGSEVTAFNREIRGKYLVPGDLVIGVEVNGAARAYPLLVLALHEMVNDTLGGRPIGVSYNPLCDSVIVFDRDGAGPTDGPPVEFGVSGLLLDSNLLLYDRRADGAPESLWSQLQRRAVTGPAAAEGRTLTLRPAELTQWGDWLRRHPETTVLAPDLDRIKQYKGTSYATYFRSDELLFPVDPMPPADGLAPKTPCVVVFAGDERRLYPVPLVLERTRAGRETWTDTLGGSALEFHVLQDPVTVRVTAGDEAAPPIVVPALWFAWHTVDPDVDVAR